MFCRPVCVLSSDSNVKVRFCILSLWDSCFSQDWVIRQLRPYLWRMCVWVEGSSLNLTLPREKDKLSSSASLWGSVWVLWKCVYSLLPSATYTILSSVEDFQEGGVVLVGKYKTYTPGTRLCWITCVISTPTLFLQVQETNQDMQWP